MSGDGDERHAGGEETNPHTAATKTDALSHAASTDMLRSARGAGRAVIA